MPDSLAASLGTILVVDDVQVVRKAVASTLRRANFHVLSACSGVKAIRLAKEAGGMIDLLLCSIQMHRMSGLALGEILKGTRPDLQVMLMMGGSNGDLLVLNHGWTMIEKQSMPTLLVQMITEVLLTARQSQPTHNRRMAANSVSVANATLTRFFHAGKAETESD